MINTAQVWGQMYGRREISAGENTDGMLVAIECGYPKTATKHVNRALELHGLPFSEMRRAWVAVVDKGRGLDTSQTFPALVSTADSREEARQRAISRARALAFASWRIWASVRARAVGLYLQQRDSTSQNRSRDARPEG